MRVTPPDRWFDAQFADGQTALRQPVRARVTRLGFLIMDENGRDIDNWPLDGLELAEEVYRGQPARLIHAQRGDANLLIQDPQAIQQLCEDVPSLRKRYLARWTGGHRLVYWGTALIAVALAAIFGLPHLSGAAAKLVPPQWEQAMGSEVADTFTTAACNEPQGRAALDQLVTRLTPDTDLPYPLHVKIVPVQTVNALAAPGGHIVLFKGLLDAAESPDEVAAVLAHEIGHAVERHPMSGLIRRIGLSLVVSAAVGDASAAVGLASGLGEHLLNMSYSRDDEAAADRLAVEMLNHANISPEGFMRFFERLDSQDHLPGDKFLELLSSHPTHDDRISTARTLGRGTGPALSNLEWKALRGICTALDNSG